MRSLIYLGPTEYLNASEDGIWGENLSESSTCKVICFRFLVVFFRKPPSFGGKEQVQWQAKRLYELSACQLVHLRTVAPIKIIRFTSVQRVFNPSTGWNFGWTRMTLAEKSLVPLVSTDSGYFGWEFFHAFTMFPLLFYRNPDQQFGWLWKRASFSFLLKEKENPRF